MADVTPVLEDRCRGMQPGHLLPQFLDAGMKRLQMADPNEGSNIHSARLAEMM